jgi:predicted phosphate transport protein (TIGR00153 family)
MVSSKVEGLLWEIHTGDAPGFLVRRGRIGYSRTLLSHRTVTFCSCDVNNPIPNGGAMPGLLTKILPYEKTFFTMFNHQAENIHAGAQALVEMLEHFETPAVGAERVESYEHVGDNITHAIMTRLNQTFITPFDREDIHELASKIDDVLDLVDAVATRLVMYRVKTIRPGVVELAKTVEEATKQIVAAVKVLEKEDHILDYCIEINRLENQADRLSRDLIAELFDSEKDPIQIIKWKEIIETLEFATDKCEDVANVIEGVTLKNA